MFPLYYEVPYDRVASAYLDCVAVNLAALLQYYAVEDLRSPFACQWYFQFHEDNALPEVLHTPLAEVILRSTGYAVHTYGPQQTSLVQVCLDFLSRQKPVLVFGDAYSMPWLPYYQQEHMEHSFIVNGVNQEQNMFHIVDAYSNQTEWGKALPCTAHLRVETFTHIVEALETERRGTVAVLERVQAAAPLDTALFLRLNAERMLFQLSHEDALRRFSRFYAQHAENVAMLRQFVLGCWLLTRARSLHAVWLADLAGFSLSSVVNSSLAQRFQEEVVAPWQQVSDFAYLTLRRVMRGRRAPLTCFEMLEQVVAPQEERLADLFLERLC